MSTKKKVKYRLQKLNFLLIFLAFKIFLREIWGNAQAPRTSCRHDSGLSHTGKNLRAHVTI
jgi:hypothetical protein